MLGSSEWTSRRRAEYIYIYICMCECVCVCVMQKLAKILYIYMYIYNTSHRPSQQPKKAGMLRKLGI